MIDREFYNAELLHEINGLKGNVLIPAKAYKKITKIIEEYLNGTGKRVRKYTLSSAPGKNFQFFQNVYLIIIMTTQKLRGQSSSWASRTSRFYKKRWFIETGFSDLNRMGRRWKSKYDNTRYLDLQDNKDALKELFLEA